MAKRHLVGLRDLKIGEYTLLLVVPHKQEVARMFLGAIGDEKSQLGRFPHDFAVHELGLLDSETGAIESIVPPVDMTPYSERDAVLIRREALKVVRPKEESSAAS